jgi:hypothetical protein
VTGEGLCGELELVPASPAGGGAIDLQMDVVAR